jgi:hypothetical protein
MTNSHKGEVEFEAEGKKYLLQYDHESLIALEDKLDKGIVKIMREMEAWTRSPEDIRLGMVRAVWWAGLTSHQPDMSLKDASALIFQIDGGFAKAIELIGDAFAKGFPAPGSRSTNPPPKGTNGTGTNSGSTTSVMDTTQIPSGISLRESSSSG